MSSYQGIGESTFIHSPSWYLERLWKCYTEFIGLIINYDTYGNAVIRKIVVIFWLVVCIWIAVKIVGLLKRKQYGNTFWTVFLGILIPVGVYCLNFLSEGTLFHRLMVQSAVLVWMIPIVLLDNVGLTAFQRLLSEGLLIVLLINCGNYAVGANISYVALHTGYEKTYALSVRIADRIEPLATETKTLYIAGAVSGDKYYDMNFDRVTRNMIGVSYKIIPYSNTLYCKMINQYVGGNYEILYDNKVKENIETSEVYQEMPAWPAEGCVNIIDDVIVVKLGK